MPKPVCVCACSVSLLAVPRRRTGPAEAILSRSAPLLTPQCPAVAPDIRIQPHYVTPNSCSLPFEYRDGAIKRPSPSLPVTSRTLSGVNESLLWPSLLLPPPLSSDPQGRDASVCLCHVVVSLNARWKAITIFMRSLLIPPSLSHTLSLHSPHECQRSRPLACRFWQAPALRKGYQRH